MTVSPPPVPPAAGLTDADVGAPDDVAIGALADGAGVAPAETGADGADTVEAAAGVPSEVLGGAQGGVPGSGTADPAAGGPRPGEADLLLVQRTVAGDQKAFELLVIKYQRRIERLIGRMVRDVNLVEDIAQETFIRAYRALHQFRGDAQFYTWLYRIAVNTAKKALVDMKRDPTVTESALRSSSDEDDETYRPGNEPISEETPESVLAAKEIAAAVQAAMEALPAELRQAVTLREIEGMSYEEVAEVMNCPIGTVRSRIFRAREAISARVKPLLDNQSGKRW